MPLMQGRPLTSVPYKGVIARNISFKSPRISYGLGRRTTAHRVASPANSVWTNQLQVLTREIQGWVNRRGIGG